jgi:tRNA(Ile2) C34 agmatinyltransferase TiaS
VNSHNKTSWSVTEEHVFYDKFSYTTGFICSYYATFPVFIPWQLNTVCYVLNLSTLVIEKMANTNFVRLYGSTMKSWQSNLSTWMRWVSEPFEHIAMQQYCSYIVAVKKENKKVVIENLLYIHTCIIDKEKWQLTTFRKVPESRQVLYLTYTGKIYFWTLLPGRAIYFLRLTYTACIQTCSWLQFIQRFN